MITASAPGQVVLFGEHAMTFGELGIATAIEKRAFVTVCELDEPKIVVQSKNLEGTLELLPSQKPHDPITKAARLAITKCGKKDQGVGIEINSKIPQNAGLGASAAIVAAASAAILQLFTGSVDIMKVAEIAFESEKVIHPNPTGVETAITTIGGTISFQRGKVEALRTQPLPLVVGNTGIATNADEMIKRVKQYIEDPRMGCTMFSIGGLVKQAKDAVIHSNFTAIGNLMDKNHVYLRNLGVSNSEIEALVKLAKDSGAAGAKLTGFGGGGSVIALAKNTKELLAGMGSSRFKVFDTMTDQPGVRIES